MKYFLLLLVFTFSFGGNNSQDTLHLTYFDLSSIFVLISAILMYINYRFIKMPMTIGVMLLSLIGSMIIASTAFFALDVAIKFDEILKSLDFNEVLMGGMLSFLLFAGSLHVDLSDLMKQKLIISILATLGVIFSTFVVGTASWYIFNGIGLDIPYIYCLLFGSLISPTDPIAVLGILKETNSPKSLKTAIAGESLFNDGVGVVVFAVILGTIIPNDHGHGPFTLFAIEAIGGLIYGLILGYVFYLLLKSIDNYPLEIMLTLALVMAGYSFAHLIGVSGPLAVVVAGLFIGNHGKLFAMSESTHKQLFSFWELIDEFLNAVLFVLMGMQLIVILRSFQLEYLYAGLISIPLILIIRYIGIKIPLMILGKKSNLIKGSEYVMTWCGLRGGISIALALSLSSQSLDSTAVDIIITSTFIIVAFSILVQGLTSKSVVNIFIDEK